VALVRIDISEEGITSIIRVERISDLGTTLAEVQESRGVTSQNMAFFIAAAIKTTTLTQN
jgi:hypothetical protein